MTHNFALTYDQAELGCKKNLKAPYIAVAYCILIFNGFAAFYSIFILQICFSCSAAGKNPVLRVICWLQSCECLVVLTSCI